VWEIKGIGRRVESQKLKVEGARRIWSDEPGRGRDGSGGGRKRFEEIGCREKSGGGI
jgi:hypothetical protein